MVVYWVTVVASVMVFVLGGRIVLVHDLQGRIEVLVVYTGEQL